MEGILMAHRRLGVMLVTLVLLLGQAQSALGAAPLAPNVGSDLPIGVDKLPDREPIETVDYIVEFTARADLRPAGQIDDFVARGEFVVGALQQVAVGAQERAVSLARNRGTEVEQFWFRNVMAVRGPSDALIAELRALPGVADVRPEKIYPLVVPVARAEAIRVAAAEPEWGVSRIGADAVWEQGIFGSGIVVANIDTGVDYTHPALVNQYRGNLGNGTFSHDYNWWDPTGICGGMPCDNVDHGTHTMGTMVGGDGPGPFTPDIGVAPGAQWIAAKGCEDFGCSESALLSSGQWMLAPTDLNGESPDPARRPDIVNNSWSGGPGDPFYLETVQAWRAAGIVPVFAAGNPGPFCGDGGSPGDYVEAFSAGATDIDDVIADFSGRGPSAFGKINPDASAPGVNVVSSIPGGNYAAFDGTSMAAPHVAGSLALVMSAAPELIGDAEAAMNSLRTTAVDIIDLTCGGDDDGDPNNVYGEGRIDVLTAVNLVATGGTLTGTVTDGATSRPIPGAKVAANNGIRDFNAFTDASGGYRLFLAADTYSVSATGFGYETAVVAGVEIITDATVVQNLVLTPLPRYTVSGVVRRAETGYPIKGATVAAAGVPVAPATTDARGRYSLRLPLGSYTIVAQLGGCMSEDVRGVELYRNTGQDFRLAQKIDDYGYGCYPIPLYWVDAKWPTTLYGDDVAGRLPMPFAFPFYGERFDEHLYISANGYVSFTDEFLGWSPPFGSPLPSIEPPNAAIYALWQDLWVTGDARVDYGRTRVDDRRALVVEYSDVANLGSDEGADFEIKLWEDGTIDLLYKDGMGNVGSGGSAVVGLEGPTGEDAFQFSYTNPVLTDGSAWRFEILPTGVVHGIVRDTNDGLPVAGATITAEPGGRSATTGADGRYELRLVPGRYKLTISAPGYTAETAPLRIYANQRPWRTFGLDAPVASVEPLALDAAVEIAESATRTLTITNTGSSPLEWEVRERELGGTPPDLPPAPDAVVTRPAEWAPFVAPDGTTRDLTAEPVFVGDLLPIIEDPIGDATQIDVTSVLGASDGITEMSMELQFSPSTPMGETVGYVFLDTDQDPATGLPAEAFGGLPTQDIGMEYFVDLFAAPEGFGYVVDADTFELVAEIGIERLGQAYRFDIPLEALGGDDGSIDVAMVVGDYEMPTDWAPDVGHGTIEPYRDAPWMSEEPTNGSLLPGEATDVTVTLGAAGIDPGTYTGLVVVVTNAPRVPTIPVDASLEVLFPDDFGSVAGVVSNARAGFPVPASITVNTERDGAPYDVAIRADDVDGSYRMFLPEGTWPVTAEFEGYAPFTGEVDVVAGTERTFDVTLDALWPEAELLGGPIELEMTPGESTTAELALSNVGGFADLEFEVRELGGVSPEARPAEAVQPGVTSRAAPKGYTPVDVDRRISNGAEVAVFVDALPWESDALFQVLDANGVPYAVYGSGEMGIAELDAYRIVIIANDQPQVFYDRYNDNAARFDEFVELGGLLWYGAASLGWNEGDNAGTGLPGGPTVASGVFEELNGVVQPDHPVMAGVPDPFSGSAVSHSAFEGATDESAIAFGEGSGMATLIEYDYGSGRVIAFGQTLEFGWAAGEDAGLILENAIPYVLSFYPFVDVPWLSVDPVAGTVPTGGAQPLTVSIDTAGLAPGTYTATLVVRTNDPLNGTLRTDVTLTVIGE
jgi:subtilisin family serine protease